MSKKECELCNKPARMFCESDQASLCFGCDEKVHAANFLVAKHSRTLLCHVCRSPTPWRAHGPKLGPTLSVCHACSDGCLRRAGGDNNNSSSSNNNNVITAGDATSSCSNGSTQDHHRSEEEEEEEEEENDKYTEESDEFDDDDSVYDSDGYSEEEDDEDGENQVVPWSMEDDATWQSGGDQTSSDLEIINHNENDSSLGAKRSVRDDYALESDEEYEYDDDTSCDSFALRPLKKIRRTKGKNALIPSSNRDKSSSGTAAIIEKLQSF